MTNPLDEGAIPSTSTIFVKWDLLESLESVFSLKDSTGPVIGCL